MNTHEQIARLAGDSSSTYLFYCAANLERRLTIVRTGSELERFLKDRSMELLAAALQQEGKGL